MKKLTFLAVLLLTAALFAHGPDKITLTWTSGENLLTVDVEHGVSNTESHYIDDIKIELNGEEIIVQKWDKQETAEGQTAVYKITQAKPGDKIEVTADCSKIGKMSQTLEIPEENKE